MNYAIDFLKDYGTVLAITLVGWAATQAFLRYEHHVLTNRLAKAERSLRQETGSSDLQIPTQPEPSAPSPDGDPDARRIHQFAIIHSRRRQAQRLLNQLEQEEARLRIVG
jgi:hypothetical protein